MAWADAEDERDVSGAVGEKGPTWLPVVGQFGIKHPPPSCTTPTTSAMMDWFRVYSFLLLATTRL
jgi:hypothetical protein